MTRRFHRAAVFRACRRAGLIALIAIAVVSLVPGQLRPHLLASGQLEHFGVYCITGLVLGLGYWGRMPLPILAVMLSIYAAALESAQLLIPGRHATLIDFYASTGGAWTGIFLILLLGWASRRSQPFPTVC